MLTAKEVTRLLDIANAGVNKGQIALARKVYEGILADVRIMRQRSSVWL